jgi:hypothetical protein
MLAPPDEQTVLGVPLQPGERVVYCFKPDPSSDNKTVIQLARYLSLGLVGVWIWQALKVGFAEATWSLLAGAVLLVLVYLGAWAFTPRTPKAQIVTSQRIIVLSHKGKPSSMLLADVTGLRADRAKGYAGPYYSNDAVGDVLAVITAVGQVSAAIDNHVAEKNTQVSSDYWAHTTAIDIIGRAQRMKLTTTEALTLGPLLARCILEQAADREPAIPYEP